MSLKFYSRNNRRAAGRRAKPAALAGATLAATALTAAITPPAASTVARHLDVALAADAVPTYPMFGIGPLGDLVSNLANWTGNSPFELPAILGGRLAWDFKGGAPTTQTIYQLLNDEAYSPVTDIPSQAPCVKASQTSCRTEFILSTGIGALGTADAINALIESAQGNTRAGFEPIKAASGTGVTQISAIYINNMLRPDGGLAARFPDLWKAFGVNPVMPTVGETGPNNDGSSVYNWINDITWPYNPQADFPITANPFSLLNSMFAVVPPPQLLKALQAEDLLGAVFNPAAGTFFSDPTDPVSLPSQTAVENLTTQWGYKGNALFGIQKALIGDLPSPSGSAFYTMLASFKPDLPITYPMYVASALVNPLLSKLNSPYLLGTPMADVFTPALKILVNIGYDDVITPDKLNDPQPILDPAPYIGLGYTAYDRTFYQLTPDKPTPFAWFNNPAITPDEMAKVPTDVWDAFTGALKAQSEKPGFGILVPNPDNPPAVGTAQPAAAVSAPADDPVPVAAQVDSTQAADEVEPEIEAPAPAEDPAPVTASKPAKAGDDSSAAGDNDNGGGHTRAARTGRG